MTLSFINVAFAILLKVLITSKILKKSTVWINNILVHHIINSYLIDVVREKRCIKYIWNLINSGCKLHAYIVILSMDNMYSTIGENMRYFRYKYIFSTNDWYRPLSFLNNKIDTYVKSTEF